jgi:outer membrane lipase/esterase
MKPKSVVLAVATLLFFTRLAEAQNFNQLIAFGNSTTDTGWFAHASSGIPDLDALVANSLAQGGNAHFTGPGPGNAQILGSFFGLSANPANTAGGTNYAIGGALNDSVLGPGVENLFAVQSGTANPSLPSTATQIRNYLASVNGHANPNALYLIGSGGNDATVASSLFSSPAEANAFLLAEAGALVSSAAQLRAAGGRYIVVTNEYTPPSADATTVAYGKTLLGATWSGLAAAGVTFVPADTLSVIAAVEHNPLAFGITAPITSNACVAPAAYPFSSGYGFLCAPTTTPSPNYGYLVSADATQTHLYMDSTHLTEAGQVIVADYIYSLLVAPSQISFLAEAPVKTRTTVVNAVLNQIPISQQDLGPGRYHAWLTGDVSYLKMDNYNGFPGDPGTPVALIGGFDYKYTREWLIGAALSVGSTKQSFSNTGNFTQEEFAASIYAAYRNGLFWGDIIGSAGTLHDGVNRSVPIGITVQPNNGNTNGTNYSLALRAGYDFIFAGLTHGPLAGIVLQRVHVGSFTESGSFTSLAFDDQLRNSAVSELGYQVGYNIGFWQPFARLVWNHELASTDRLVTAYLTTITAPGYSMPAVILGKDWGSATAGTAVKIANNVTGLIAGYAQFAEKNITVYGGQIGFNVAFGVPAAPDVLVVKAPRQR